jgi:hypothetical protein
MIVDTYLAMTPDQGWLIGRNALAFDVANAVSETLEEKRAARS